MSGTRLRIFHRHKTTSYRVSTTPAEYAPRTHLVLRNLELRPGDDLLSLDRKRHKVQHPTHAIRMLNHPSDSRQDIQVTSASFGLDT
jgi:hypothetical protein